MSKIKKLILLGAIFSVLVYLVSLFTNNIREEQLLNSEIFYASKNDSVNFSIIAIKSEINAQDYLSAIQDKVETVNFNFILVNPGEKLYLLEELPNGLCKVGLKTTYKSPVRPPYLEC